MDPILNVSITRKGYDLLSKGDSPETYNDIENLWDYFGLVKLRSLIERFPQGISPDQRASIPYYDDLGDDELGWLQAKGYIKMSKVLPEGVVG